MAYYFSKPVDTADAIADFTAAMGKEGVTGRVLVEAGSVHEGKRSRSEISIAYGTHVADSAEFQKIFRPELVWVAYDMRGLGPDYFATIADASIEPAKAICIDTVSVIAFVSFDGSNDNPFDFFAKDWSESYDLSEVDPLDLCAFYAFVGFHSTADRDRALAVMTRDIVI
ncbi:hypothetical protein [Rhizobium sp. 2MFCol3.1]|uniref:hypothetical protein n=1 Tax=Rhizobium sp. 2MFCol3.1 TaxID=1246459 RepID=UPI000361BCCB|nr:hypothetical protein [Rhizobium sp. 2MFCol3.1]